MLSVIPELGAERPPEDPHRCSAGLAVLLKDYRRTAAERIPLPPVCKFCKLAFEGVEISIEEEGDTGGLRAGPIDIPLLNREGRNRTSAELMRERRR